MTTQSHNTQPPCRRTRLTSAGWQHIRAAINQKENTVNETQKQHDRPVIDEVTLRWEDADDGCGPSWKTYLRPGDDESELTRDQLLGLPS